MYQVKKTIGAYAAAMGGLDAVAFTGGIGENSARLAGGLLRRAGVSGNRAGSEREPERQRRPRWSPRQVRRSRCCALATNEELIVARRRLPPADLLTFAAFQRRTLVLIGLRLLAVFVRHPPDRCRCPGRGAAADGSDLPSPLCACCASSPAGPSRR